LIDPIIDICWRSWP